MVTVMVPNLSMLWSNSLYLGLAAAFASIAFCVTVAALVYSRNLDVIRETARANKKVTRFYTLDVISSLRKLTFLSLLFLKFVAFAMFVALLYGDPRPPISPAWVFYVNLSALMMFPFYVCLPALLMVVLVRRAKRFAGVRDSEIIEKLDPKDERNE